MSLSGINFAGLGSGIDTQSIMQRLLEIEAIPIRRLQGQRNQLEAKQSLFSTLKGQLQNLAAKAGALNNSTAFSIVKASSSDEKIATISAAEGAVAGTYSLNVTNLAQIHKVSSSAFADTTSAVNLAGEFVVNGKTVEVAATDSLTSIAQKVNGLNAGVTASVINGGAGNAYLSLTATRSGLENKIQVADVNGGAVAQSLGFVAGAASLANPVANGFASRGFSSTSTTLGAMLGNADHPAGTIELNGQSITVDFATDTLQSLVGKINTSGAGATASIETVKVNGTDTYRIKVVGATTPTYNDPNGIMGELGFTQRAFGNQLVAAEDAVFTLDNINFTSASNSITTIVPGVTINLLKEDAATLTLSQDNSAVKTKIKDLMDAYNGVIDFVKAQSSFDKETFASAPLFGDSTVRTVESMLAGQIFGNVTGLSTSYSNLTQLGFSFDSDAKLTLDEAALDSALAANPAAVGNLFRASGQSAVDSITYVSSTSKTKPSTPAGYAVNITQAATKTYAQFALGGALTVADKLTFNGALFGSTPYELNINAGATVTDIVAQINSDSKLKDLVVATDVGGELKIESKRFGTPGDFTVSESYSGQDPGPNIVLVRNAMSAGVNVAGTIGGFAATGSGQFLTGSEAGKDTEGLQIQYTGATLGGVGNITVSIGIGAAMNNLVNQLTDSVSGMLTGNDKAITDQIATIDESISAIQKRIASKQIDLQRRFSAMENAIAQMQQQGAQLSAISTQRSVRR